ncbi:MAG: ATP-binding protein [Candidatus Nealsonbacteria bacterium]|nr:ATP-binding protein [Candidatus Nealsonbacteria bacterium]
MTRRTLKMGLGNWVDGDRFWGREDDLAIFISRITDGAHQSLIAQRRMGKTSLMKETARRLEDQYLCLFVDLQKCSAAPDAVVQFGLAVRPYQSLWKRFRSVFSNAFEGFRDSVDSVNLGEIGISLRADFASQWRQKGDQLLEMLAASETPVLLLVDEAPILVNRILKGSDYQITSQRRQDADLFLSWIRDNAVRHQGKIRMVLSGSIGLEPILRQGRLSATLNNFEPFELQPWDEDTASGCLEALAAEYNLRFEEGVPDEMVKMLGCCIPHHVQMFFRHAHDWCRRHGQSAISRQDVKTIYRNEMLSIRGHAELTHYEERLKLVLGDELLPTALELLTETAVVGSLTSEATGMICAAYEFESSSAAEARRQILDVLEHDGYLEQKRKRYRFVSKLLRDWWKTRHGFGYIRTSKRGA